MPLIVVIVADRYPFDVVFQVAPEICTFEISFGPRRVSGTMKIFSFRWWKGCYHVFGSHDE